jgi:hypothetical protein
MFIYARIAPQHGLTQLEIIIFKPIYRYIEPVSLNVHSIVGEFLKLYFQTNFVKRNPCRPRDSLMGLVRWTLILFCIHPCN